MNTNVFTQILESASKIHNIGRFRNPTDAEMQQARNEILQLLNND